WEWDGARWTRVATTGPSARSLTRLAYDPSRGKVVLFGGWNGSAITGDTWEWDGATWQPISDDGPARFLHGMVIEDAGSRMLVFGGSAWPPGGPEFAGTWARTAQWDSLP